MTEFPRDAPPAEASAVVEVEGEEWALNKVASTMEFIRGNPLCFSLSRTLKRVLQNNTNELYHYYYYYC